MDIKEVSLKLGKSENTLQQQFKRTQENLKKRGILLEREKINGEWDYSLGFIEKMTMRGTAEAELDELSIEALWDKIWGVTADVKDDFLFELIQAKMEEYYGFDINAVVYDIDEILGEHYIKRTSDDLKKIGIFIGGLLKTKAE